MTYKFYQCDHDSPNTFVKWKFDKDIKMATVFGNQESWRVPHTRHFHVHVYCGYVTTQKKWGAHTSWSDVCLFYNICMIPLLINILHGRHLHVYVSFHCLWIQHCIILSTLTEASFFQTGSNCGLLYHHCFRCKIEAVCHNIGVF